VVARRARRVYRTLIVIPENPESGKERHAAALWRRIGRKCPRWPYSNPNKLPSTSEKRLADRLAQEAEPNRRACSPDQWNNLDNAKGAFTIRPGPGKSGSRPTGKDRRPSSARSEPAGTLAGISRYLKEKEPRPSSIALPPILRGAAMYELFKHGQAKTTRRADRSPKAIGARTGHSGDRDPRRSMTAYLIPDGGNRAGDLRAASSTKGLCLRRLDRRQRRPARIRPRQADGAR